MRSRCDLGPASVGYHRRMGTRTGAAAKAPGGGGRWALVLPSLVAVAGLLLTAAPANASFHLMKIREVHTGGASGGSYVVLQMWTGGQNFVSGHPIVIYNANGTVAHTFTFSGNVAKGDSQATILVAGTGYATAFPSGPSPDATDSELNLPATGGAVCFTQAEPPDCVSWGNFTGAGSLPSATGTPASAGGVTAGKALHRSISAPCATLLEPSDDTNNSAADFSEQSPNPRSNASPIVETSCPSLPNTTIGTKPANPTKNTSASFTFTATPSAGASFECKLDAEPSFTSCTSPKEYTGLSEDTHTFEVQAVNSAGTDPSPAIHQWRGDLTPPTATILTQPGDPGPGDSASFTYSSNEAGSSFQCSLEPVGELESFSPCPSGGKTYPDATHPAPFADGDWVFKVRATDLAKNEGAADVFEWTVDNTLNDVTDPQTTIVAKPPNPSTSPNASFTYESNELESTFECKLDGGAFVGCDPVGVTYFGLANGPHSFQVRAMDAVGNLDDSPASYNWDVAVPAFEPPPILPPPLPELASAAAPPRKAPQTILTAKPGAVTRDRTPSFRFRSNVAGATFGCKVDRGAFRSCSSPFTTKTLSFGPHAVQIRAVVGGTADPTPAKSSFRIAKPKGRGRR